MFRNSLFSNFANSVPFNVPNMANNLNTFSKISNVSRTLPKFSLTGLLDNASRTVNTINQIIPIYNQVKPMFNNAKTALNIFKNVKNINNTPIVNETLINETKIETPKENIIKEEKVIINKLNPNKPFFV